MAVNNRNHAVIIQVLNILYNEADGTDDVDGSGCPVCRHNGWLVKSWWLSEVCEEESLLDGNSYHYQKGSILHKMKPDDIIR